MSEKNLKKQSGWQELANNMENSSSVQPSALSASESGIPGELKVRLTHGAWFGIAMGIGFSIGFLISFLALIGFVGFVIYSRFPGLFS